MKYLSIIILSLLLSNLVYTQNSAKPNTRQDALNVYIDCGFCDIDYIRNNISYINYVRDTKVAQVHILTTTQRTGSGGTAYIFNFIGQQEFDGKNDTISVIANSDATSDERRAMRTHYIQIGLMQYVAKTAFADFISIDYTNNEAGSETVEVVDNWNYWVFRLSAHGWFNGEESYKSKNLSGSISANRVTDKWKLENYARFGYSDSNFKIDSVTNIFNTNRNYYAESAVVRAINDHWSTGLVLSVNSSTFNNIQFNHQISPALEYNIFKYTDFSRKQIRLQYRIGFIDYQYVDTTIYNNIKESLFNHRVSVAAEFKQKWGSVSFHSTASQYLHDTSLKKLTLFGRISWRIFKGLSFNADGSLDFIQDQIALPKGGASDVEILTQQRQLETQYSYWGSIGISFTFGSIYNNVVNPRFGN